MYHLSCMNFDIHDTCDHIYSVYQVTTCGLGPLVEAKCMPVCTPCKHTKSKVLCTITNYGVLVVLTQLFHQYVAAAHHTTPEWPEQGKEMGGVMAITPSTVDQPGGNSFTTTS